MDVEFTDYALMRMHMRDILEEEVKEALAAPASRHKNRADGRSEVTTRVGRRTLLVVYALSSAQITVINAMWE